MSETTVLTVSNVSQLAGHSDATTRAAADSGRLPVLFRKADGERLFGVVDGVLYAVNRRFKLDLQQVDSAGADELATAIKHASAADVASAYPVIQAFASLVDSGGQFAIASAIQKMVPLSTIGFGAGHDVQKVTVGGDVRKG